MASCGVRLRNSLAGNVCRRWRRELATLKGVFRKKGFRKGELTTCGAIIWHALTSDRWRTVLFTIVMQPLERFFLFFRTLLSFFSVDLPGCSLLWSDEFESYHTTPLRSPLLLFNPPPRPLSVTRALSRPAPYLLKCPVFRGIVMYARARWSCSNSLKVCVLIAYSQRSSSATPNTYPETVCTAKASFGVFTSALVDLLHVWCFQIQLASA